ncbi:MAG: hypothetical protein GXO87_01270 [Chlorobi bacterium]|nr:hypothetical protein [Chlorobiota bacterium]
MKRRSIYVLLFVVLPILFLSACSKKEENKTTKKVFYPKEYSLSLTVKNKGNLNDSLIAANLDSAFYSLSVKPSDKIKNRFAVRVDSISSYDAAWMQGFHFSEYFKLKDINIFKNKIKQEEKYREFYFVGDYLGRAALYSMDLFTRKTNLVWSRWGKPILKLFRQNESGGVYFTVAQKLSRRGGFPSIRRAQLFLFQKEKMSVRRIDYYGNGMQLKAGWISPNLFNTQFLLLDSLTNADVIKRTSDYDAAGNLLDTLTEKIALMSVSFKEKAPELKFEADSKKIMIKFREREDTAIASVVDFLKGLKTDVFEFKGKIISTKWSGDENYFLMTTVDSVQTPADSVKRSVRNLFVVNLRNHKLLTVISGNLDEYLFHGKILVYDCWINGVKNITFYDLMRREEIMTLNFEGGCGINSILNFNNL